MALSPSQFPSLIPPSTRRSFSSRGFHVCSVCRLSVEPRNSRAHAKACTRRKAQDPALWLLWKLEMHGATVARIRQAMPPLYLQQLALRGLLQHGPVNRRGQFSGEEGKRS